MPFIEPCQRLTYEIDVERYAPNSVYNEGDSRDLYVFYSTNRERIVTEAKMMSGNNLLSAVGGGLGLFLGLSVIAVVNFVLDRLSGVVN